MPHTSTLLRASLVSSQGLRQLDLLQTSRDIIVLRRAELVSEARRLLRRRTTTMALAARCRAGSRRLSFDAAEVVATRAMRRAAALHLRFHNTLDALVAAGGFDEAIGILQERRQTGSGNQLEPGPL
jgi:hypothetical protein